MKLKYELCYSIFILISATLILIAFLLNNDNFWKLHDSGILLLISTLTIMIRKYHIISIAMLMLVALALNAWVTSMFYDVKLFGDNQKYFGWGLAIILFVIGAIYNILKHVLKKRQEKKDLECKKDARDKYKNMLNKIDSVDSKLTRFENKINQIING